MLGARGIVERRDRSIATRHRPAKPSTTEGQIDVLASAIAATSVADHVAESDPHTQYQKESDKDTANGYAGLDAGGLVPDARIAASIARDSEVATAAADALSDAEDYTDLQIAAHEADATDIHPQYQKESDKDQNNGYLGADASARLTSTRLSMSATDKLLGRSTAGAGASEEITCTAAARALLDDADAAAMRTTLDVNQKNKTHTVQGIDSSLTPTTDSSSYFNTFAADATLDFAVNYGFLIISDNSGGEMAVMMFYNSLVTIVSQSAGNIFTTALGTGSKINVAFTGGNLRIQNKFAGNRVIRGQILKLN